MDEYINGLLEECEMNDSQAMKSLYDNEVQTIEKEWKEISFLFKFRYMILASVNRIKRYL